MKNYKCLIISVYIILILLIKTCVNYEEWNPPKNLTFINSIYKSNFRISIIDHVILTYDSVYFISDGLPKILKYKESKVYTLYGNTFIKPLLYTYTDFKFESIFFTKDCYLYLYSEKGENTFNYYSLFSRKFQLGSCYDSLRIYYDTNTKNAVVYNYNASKKIIVFSVREAFYNDNNNIVIEINNDYLVKQSLIHSYNEKKSLIIVIDIYAIRFYNIKGYKNKYWFFNDEGGLIKSKEGYDGFADFIDDGNKLLFAYSNNFIVFELENLNVISEKHNLLYGDVVQCLLKLNNGNVLVGTNEGYIYLIGYINKEIKIMDYRKICDDKVYSLSYNNICADNSKTCYVFAANCGYLYVFEIGIKKEKENNSYENNYDENNSYENNSDENNSDETNYIIFILAFICIVGIIIYLYKKYKD